MSDQSTFAEDGADASESAFAIDEELGPSGKSVLVTGGAGFIGSHLASALAVDNDVTILDNCSTGDRDAVPEGATFHRGDVRDRETLEPLVAESDVVYHEAAIVSVEDAMNRPVESHATNVSATVNLLDLARKYDARVVFASSCAIYGNPSEVPISESERTAPLSPYGVDKLSADHYVRVYGQQYDVETVALRYFNVYGPGQRGDYSGVIDAFLSRALEGEPIEVHGAGDQTRDFVHVSDVVRANLAAGVTAETGSAYNVGTGVETSVLELAETIRDLVETDSPIVHTDPRPGDIERSRADLSRAKRFLDYRPRIPLSTGLESVLQSYDSDELRR